MRYCVITVLAVVMAVPAAAQERTAYRTIIAGDYADAARTIEAQRKANPDQPELMLNLAAAYARMGRVGEARALYAGVLDARAVPMDMPSGAVLSSHDVATRGLARLSPTIASR